MAGGERLRAEPLAELEHRVEAHVAVAAHARVGRQAGVVVGEPTVDDAGAELGAQVDREVRHAEAVGKLARAAHGLRRAAARLAVVLGVRPQLERDADGLGAVAGDEQRGDCTVDTAAHRDEHARRGRGEPRLLARGPAERAVQGIGGELGGVALGGAEPAELRFDLLGADPRGLEQRDAADQADGGAAGGDRRAAATRVEAGIEDPAGGAALIDASEMRTRSPQAAPPAAPVCASGGMWPRRSGRSRCCCKLSEALLTLPSLRLLGPFDFLDGLADRESVGQAGQARGTCPWR